MPDARLGAVAPGGTITNSSHSRFRCGMSCRGSGGTSQCSTRASLLRSPGCRRWNRHLRRRPRGPGREYRVSLPSWTSSRAVESHGTAVGCGRTNLRGVYPVLGGENPRDERRGRRALLGRGALRRRVSGIGLTFRRPCFLRHFGNEKIRGGAFFRRGAGSSKLETFRWALCLFVTMQKWMSRCGKGGAR